MPSTQCIFTEGLIVLVESDTKGEWWVAQDWQSSRFIKAMNFGSMKSMGGVSIPSEKSESFTYNSFSYHFILEFENGGPPCYIVNENTGKKRRILYYDLEAKIYQKPTVASQVKVKILK